MKIVGEELHKLWPHLLVSVLLAQLGTLAMLSLIPLQVVYYQKGLKPYLMVLILWSLITFPLLYVVQSMQGLVFESILLQGSYLFWLVGGLLVFTLVHLHTGRHLYGLMAGSATSVVFALLLVAILSSLPNFVEWWAIQLKTINELLTTSLGSSWKSFEIQYPGGYQALVIDLLENSYGQVYFLILLFVVVLARRGSSDPSKARIKLKDFFLPENFLWLFLGSWLPTLALILLERNGIIISLGWGRGILAYLANVTLLLFCLQGLGILFSFLEKKMVNPILLMFIRVVLVVLFLGGGTATITSIIFSLLGVSENWIKYRMILRSQG